MHISNFSGPSHPPVNIDVIPFSPTSVTVSWDPVPAIHQNGNITHYEITYNQSTFHQVLPSTERIPADEESVTVTGLEENVVYSIRVRAYTHIGDGPYSPVHNIRTPEDGKCH